MQGDASHGTSLSFTKFASVFGWDETLQVQDSSLVNQWFMVNDLQEGPLRSHKYGYNYPL